MLRKQGSWGPRYSSMKLEDLGNKKINKNKVISWLEFPCHSQLDNQSKINWEKNILLIATKCNINVQTFKSYDTS